MLFFLQTMIKDGWATITHEFLIIVANYARNVPTITLAFFLACRDMQRIKPRITRGS